MPKLAEFFGISIYLYCWDRPPAHFHAVFRDREVVVRIHDLTVLDGALPPRALGLVIEWAGLHRRELARAWARAEALQHPPTIDPLE